MRRLGFLFLAGSALVILFLAGEVALRAERTWARRNVARYREANVFEKGREVLEASGDTLWLQPGVRYRPGARLAMDVAGERYEIVINSRGFRSHEFAERKPPGVFRVICIGGSTTVQGRTNDDTYPAHLERMLRARYPGREIEVLNLGINGTGSEYWLERMDELFRYEPDVILQYELVNDLFFRYLPRYAVEHPYWTRARRSLLIAWLLPPCPGDLEPYVHRTLRNLRQMALEARGHRAAHVVGAFAAPDATTAERSFRQYLDENAEAWGGRAGLRFYRDYYRLLEDYDARLHRAGDTGQLVVAPVDARVRDAGQFIDLCHMTAPGIEALAGAFALTLSSQTPLP
jgi:lysophospholipase L1-like esterase